MLQREGKSIMSNILTKQIQDFTKLWGGFRASRVVLTANNYGVFDHLKAPKTAGDIARVISADPRATEILLDAVTAVGLLKKSGGKYRNTETAGKFLVKDSPLYQGDMLRHADSLWKSWSGLDEVVRPVCRTVQEDVIMTPLSGPCITMPYSGRKESYRLSTSRVLGVRSIWAAAQERTAWNLPGKRSMSPYLTFQKQ